MTKTIDELKEILRRAYAVVEHETERSRDFMLGHDDAVLFIAKELGINIFEQEKGK